MSMIDENVKFPAMMKKLREKEQELIGKFNEETSKTTLGDIEKAVDKMLDVTIGGGINAT